MTPIELLLTLVEITAEKWLSTQRFVTLSERCGAKEPKDQIHFLTAIKAILRDMPVQVFVDDEQRQAVLTAVQDALDQAIDREEQEY